jgi:RNA-directed DNA polymerase
MVYKKNLPYFYNQKKKDFASARFVRNIFFPFMRKECHGTTSLFEPRIKTYIYTLQKQSKTYSFFLRFDIKKFYPTIPHKNLREEISDIYLSHRMKKTLSRGMRIFLEQTLPAFLDKSPFVHEGIPLGNPLSHILAEIYFYRLECFLSEKNIPYLRFCDDFLLFFKEREQINNTLSQHITPLLQSLGLHISPEKTSSGRFGRDPVTFLGYRFFSGYFSIEEDRIRSFKHKITRLTILPRKINERALIKRINAVIKGFGHYYKFADCQKTFEALDAFTRKRLRRKLCSQRSTHDTTPNLIYTNTALEERGLASLAVLRKKYLKKRGKKKKKPPKAHRSMTQTKRETPYERSARNALPSILLEQQRQLRALRNEVVAMKKSIDRLTQIAMGTTDKKAPKHKQK